MPQLGAYESVQRLHSTSVGALYSVKKAGGGAELWAARALEPPGLWDDEKVTLEVDLFLNRAEIQQKIANLSDYFAKIYDFGRFSEGVYYVTDVYPRTASK